MLREKIEKIKVTQYGYIHYYAQCQNCDWDAGINTEDCKNASEVRTATRLHVIKTGHSVVIGAGKETLYEMGGHNEPR